MPHPGPSHAVPPLNVLIADDHRDSADSTAMLVRWAGYDATVAYDGPHALRAAGASRPDIALLDLEMPGLSGYEVAKALGRPRHEGRPPLLIAVTAGSRGDEPRRSMDAGFELLLTKPVDPKELLAAFERFRLSIVDSDV